MPVQALVQPHPLYPPLLKRRGGIGYIREVSPLFDAPLVPIFLKGEEGGYVRKASYLFDLPLIPIPLEGEGEDRLIAKYRKLLEQKG